MQLEARSLNGSAGHLVTLRIYLLSTSYVHQRWCLSMHPFRDPTKRCQVLASPLAQFTLTHEHAIFLS